MAVKKTGKHCDLAIYAYLEDGSFTAVKRDAAF